MTTSKKAVDYGVPEGIEIIDTDGKRKRAFFKIASPLDPSEFILLESLPDKTKQGSDPYTVTVPAEEEGAE